MQTRGEDEFSLSVHVSGFLERLRREPALRGFVLTAPTRALASLGVSIDDAELVQLLEEVEAMDQRPRVVTASDVMTANVISISPEASTHAAAVVLTDNQVSGLPVVASDGRIEGMLSVYDLLSKSGETVREVMSSDVITVLDTAPISVVRATLVSKHVRRLPVVDAMGSLVGIISLVTSSESLPIASCVGAIRSVRQKLVFNRRPPVSTIRADLVEAGCAEDCHPGQCISCAEGCGSADRVGSRLEL